MFEQTIHVTNSLHWVAVFQHALFGLIAWVTIGVYGTFYVLQSLAYRFNASSKGLVINDGKQLPIIPESVREMPFQGLFVSGLCGPIGVFVFVVVALAGRRLVWVRRPLLLLILDDESRWR